MQVNSIKYYGKILSKKILRIHSILKTLNFHFTSNRDRGFCNSQLKFISEVYLEISLILHRGSGQVIPLELHETLVNLEY